MDSQPEEIQSTTTAFRDDAIVHVVSGMISTIQFNPSMAHPGNCHNMAAMVVEQVRRWDSESLQPEGPRDHPDARP